MSVYVPLCALDYTYTYMFMFLHSYTHIHTLMHVLLVKNLKTIGFDRTISVLQEGILASLNSCTSTYQDVLL